MPRLSFLESRPRAGARRGACGGKGRRGSHAASRGNRRGCGRPHGPGPASRFKEMVRTSSLPGLPSPRPSSPLPSAAGVCGMKPAAPKGGPAAGARALPPRRRLRSRCAAAWRPGKARVCVCQGPGRGARGRGAGARPAGGARAGMPARQARQPAFLRRSFTVPPVPRTQRPFVGKMKR